MLSQQEISDHIEIQQLMVRYANALDMLDFDRMDDVFTPDAEIDYTAMGGIKGPYPEIKKWLSGIMSTFPGYQHLVGNIEADIKGDKATARVCCHNPMIVKGPDGEEHVMFLGLWYLDELVRTDKGWRIAKRGEQKSYTYNVPAFMQANV